MIEKYGADNVFVVSTEEYDLTTNPKQGNRQKDRSIWSDNVVSQLYNGTKRSEIIKQKPRYASSGEYNFSYIKFAQNCKEEIYGVVNGKSSFHCMYPSDVWFYDLTEDGKEGLKMCMEDNKLQWYTKEILILKNKNTFDSEEACKNEKIMQKLFNLYD